MTRLARLVVAFALMAAPVAWGQPTTRPVDGVTLARTIEATQDEAARGRLCARVAELPAVERDALVAWAAARWKAGGWGRLAPALGAANTPAAAKLLARVAEDGFARRLPRETVDDAVLALGRFRPAVVFDLLWPLWSDPDHGDLYRDALARSVGLDPATGVARLRAALEAASREQEALPPERREAGAERRAREDRLADLLAAALAETDAPDAFVAAVDPASAPLPLARGLVLGVRRRVPSRAALLDEARADTAAPAEDEPEPAEPAEELDYPAELQEERASFAWALLTLAERDEPSLTVEVFGALPFVLDRLTEDWAPVLLGALETPADLPAHRKLRDGAYACLRRVTGERLPHSRALWERWWAQAEKEDR